MNVDIKHESMPEESFTKRKYMMEDIDAKLAKMQEDKIVTIEELKLSGEWDSIPLSVLIPERHEHLVKGYTDRTFKTVRLNVGYDIGSITLRKLSNAGLAKRIEQMQRNSGVEHLGINIGSIYKSRIAYDGLPFGRVYISYDRSTKVSKISLKNPNGGYSIQGTVEGIHPDIIVAKLKTVFTLIINNWYTLCNGDSSKLLEHIAYVWGGGKLDSSTLNKLREPQQAISKLPDSVKVILDEINKGSLINDDANTNVSVDMITMLNLVKLYREVRLVDKNIRGEYFNKIKGDYETRPYLRTLLELVLTKSFVLDATGLNKFIVTHSKHFKRKEPEKFDLAMAYFFYGYKLGDLIIPHYITDEANTVLMTKSISIDRFKRLLSIMGLR